MVFFCYSFFSSEKTQKQPLLLTSSKKLKLLLLLQMEQRFCLSSCIEMRIMCEGGGIFLKNLGSLRNWGLFCEICEIGIGNTRRIGDTISGFSCDLFYLNHLYSFLCKMALAFILVSKNNFGFWLHIKIGIKVKAW